MTLDKIAQTYNDEDRSMKPDPYSVTFLYLEAIDNISYFNSSEKCINKIHFTIIQKN